MDPASDALLSYAPALLAVVPLSAVLAALVSPRPIGAHPLCPPICVQEMSRQFALDKDSDLKVSVSVNHSLNSANECRLGLSES